MPQLIEVPNYGQVEFPDNMSDEDISSAIKRSMTVNNVQSPSTEKQQESQPSINSNQIQEPERYDANMMDLVAGALSNLDPVLNISSTPGLNALADLGKSIPQESIPPSAINTLKTALNPASAIQGLGRVAGGGGFTQNPVSAYDMLGVKDMPFNTIPGFVQTIGSVITPGSLSLKKFGNFIKPVNWKNQVEKMQSKHDLLKKHAGGAYEMVKNALSRKNSKPLPMNNEVRNIIDESKNIITNLGKNDIKLFENAKNGKYEDLHNLQTFIRQEAESHLSSANPEDRRIGKALLDYRKSLNTHVEESLDSIGEYDLADTLRSGRKMYKKLHDVYYPEKAGYIGSMFRKENRKIGRGETPGKGVLTEYGDAVERLLSEHPDVKKEVDRYRLQQTIKNSKLGRGVKGVGGDVLKYGSIYGGYKILQTAFNSIFGNNQSRYSGDSY